MVLECLKREISFRYKGKKELISETERQKKGCTWISWHENVTAEMNYIIT